jgi:hypothetical protein
MLSTGLRGLNMHITTSAVAILVMAISASAPSCGKSDPTQGPPGRPTPHRTVTSSFASAPETEARTQKPATAKDAETARVADATPVDTIIDARAFRERFPAPEGLEKALAAFRIANGWIEVHARHGASAFVSLFYPDGSTGYGRDYFFSGSRMRFKEVRWNYLIIADRRGGCELEGSSREWKCDRDWVPFLGIHALYPEAVVAWRHMTVRCEYGRCTLWRVTLASSQSAGGVRMVTADPDRNRTIYSVVLRATGEPVMYTEQELIGGERKGPDTSYVFDFRTHVRDFGLPRLP